MSAREVRIANVRIGGGAPLALIAGPCVLESNDAALDHAARLKDIAAAAGVPFVFKASFDKANRTKSSSFRGPGLDLGLDILANVKAKLDVPVLTDVHEANQCARVALVVDALQIPAFLCRQTDLLIAAAEAKRVVNIKKGQFVAPEDMEFACEKAAAALGVLLTERGTTFGHRDLVVDFRGLAILRKFAPVVFDATHAVQRPGALAGRSGGSREEVAPLARAAVAAGIDALFLEVHPDPDRAPSDGPNSLDYDGLARVLREATAIRNALDAA